MNEMLVEFLQDVAQGVYGKSTLTYSDVYKFEKKADKADIEEIKEYFWDFTSSLTDEEDIDVAELEEFVKNVINK